MKTHRVSLRMPGDHESNEEEVSNCSWPAHYTFTWAAPRCRTMSARQRPTRLPGGVFTRPAHPADIAYTHRNLSC